eukprot:1398561-Rhodomonas_salina.2
MEPRRAAAAGDGTRSMVVEGGFRVVRCCGLALTFVSDAADVTWRGGKHVHTIPSGADTAQTSRDLFGLHLDAGQELLVRENQSQTEPGQWRAVVGALAVRATAVHTAPVHTAGAHGRALSACLGFHQAGLEVSAVQEGAGSGLAYLACIRGPVSGHTVVPHPLHVLRPDLDR